MKDITAVGLHFPPSIAGTQVRVEYAAQLLAKLHVLNRHQDFDATLQVTFHTVGGADEIFLLPSIVEVVDASVLQEAADDADDANVLRQPRKSRTQAAGIAHHEIYSHPCLRGEI